MKLTTYISMLRGINVGGKTVKMEALRKMCDTLGFSEVQTYIQSGNIIFRHKSSSTEKISDLIKTAIKKTFSFDVPVLTLTIPEMEKVYKANPFIKQKEKEDKFLHVTFLSEKPTPASLETLAEGDYGNDEFICREKAIYLYCPNGYGNTKLHNTFLEKKLGIRATTRNWKTTGELLTIATAKHAQNE